MSEKFVDPPNNVSSAGRKNFFGPSRGSGGKLLPKILKMMYLGLAEIAFHGISAVKIKCHLTIYLTMFQKFHEFNGSSIFYKNARVFSFHACERENGKVCFKHDVF